VPKVVNQYFSWYHQAIDIGGAYGTPIYAAAGGIVVDAKKQNYSFGWYCIIDIGGGMTVAYAHMSDLACSMGQQISKGQYIGAIGTTGRATGPHLHFEVRQGGRAVDPLALLN
jgi:murein DD-endopeptidase MepM/ murein hydrolase activator NlpD